MSNISPLAYVHPEAVIGENCEIGPFCYIDKNVVIGNGNKIMNSVTILSGTRMGDGNTVFPGAVIGAVPQDLKFRGEETPERNHQPRYGRQGTHRNRQLQPAHGSCTRGPRRTNGQPLHHRKHYKICR